MTNTSAGALKSAIDVLRRLGGPLFAVMEGTGLAMVVTNPRLPDHPIVFVNEAFTHLTGYSSEEVLGRNCRLLQGPSVDPATVIAIATALREGTQSDTTILNHRKDGTTFWNRLLITPIGDSAGPPLFHLATLVDITATEQATATETELHARQAELEELNERLRTTLSISGAAASWEWHIAEKRVVGDNRFARLYGLRPEDAAAGLDPTTFFSIIHPEDRDRIRLAVGGMLRGAEVLSKEYRLVLNDGSIRWVHARGRTHYDEDDRPTRFTGMLIDITDQKRLGEQLRIAQTAGGIGTFEYIDGFGTVTVSAQFCNLLGLHAAPVLPVRTINALVHRDDPPIIEANARPVPGKAALIDFRITRPDNGEERWLTRRGEYLRDAETAGVRFSGVVYDITDAKRTEEQLRTLNETLESRVEARTRERDQIWRISRDLYVLCGSDGRCRSTNPAWESELGYATGVLQGLRLGDLVDPADRATMDAAIDRLAAGEHIEGFDVRMVGAGGERRWFSWSGVPEGDAFYAAGRDITHRRELEEQLRQSHKMEAVGQLTGGIAHDFNNLLTGIIASLDMLRRRLDQGRFDSVDRFMDAATTSAQRAASLTHRLLAFSRRQSLDVQAIDVNHLVISIEDLLRRTLGEQVALVVKPKVGLWMGLSDSNQLESVLLNLAINGRDAMPDGGTLTIATANVSLTDDYTRDYQELEPGDYVVIGVTDTGTGMSPDIVAKAFDPFFTTKPIGQGTGLGLSMVYGFAKQTGGHVRITSAPGAGTTVEVYLRRHLGQSVAPAARHAAPVLADAQGEAVLVIEDDPAVRLLVMELLNELGYEAIEAVDSHTAVVVLESDRKLDLMISDVGLPEISGRQLAEIARRHRPGLKILFITGYTESAAVRSDFLVEGMELIAKPFSIDGLAAKIRQMLQ